MKRMDLLPEHVEIGIVQDQPSIPVYTVLEKKLMTVLRQTKLTERQRELLDMEVTDIQDQIWSSPNKTYEGQELFRSFADSKMIAMASHGAKAAQIISALRAYAHPNGWLAFRDRYRKDKEVGTGQDIEGII